MQDVVTIACMDIVSNYPLVGISEEQEIEEDKEITNLRENVLLHVVFIAVPKI